MVINGPEATAGSIFIELRVSGIRVPTRDDIIIVTINILHIYKEDLFSIAPGLSYKNKKRGASKIWM